MHCETCQQFQDKIGALLYPTRLALNTNHGAQERHANSAPARVHTEFPAWLSHDIVLFNSLGELEAASDSRCLICRRVYHCIEKHEWKKLHEYTSVVTHLAFGKKDGAPELQVRFEIHPELQYPLTRNPRRLGDYFFDLEDEGSLVDTLEYCANAENASTRSEASFELVRFWLDECLTKHPDCARGRSGWLPTRVIDVGESNGSTAPRLVESETLLRSDLTFVALSHCWGPKQIITTTTTTLEDRKRGIDSGDLSQTFNDVVETTRRLGQRFLWIDSLCIIQDSVEDWQAESVQMFMIYERALFTIMAAHASAGDEGCFVSRDGAGHLPLVLRFYAPDKSVSQTACFQLPVRMQGLYPRFSPVLFTRAWVLQEQWNSRARLIFFGNQVHWECKTRHRSEQRPLHGHAEWDSVVGLQRFSESWSELHPKWLELVRNYTRRGITKASDRLIAIDGIAQNIQIRGPGRYLAGLWSEHLLMGLMWYIPWSLTKSGPWHDLSENAATYLSSRHEKAIAPTWSWASVTFPVDWMCLISNDIHVDDFVEVLQADTHGTPFEMRGTLTLRGMTRRLFVKPYYQDLHFIGTKTKNPKIRQFNAINAKPRGAWPVYTSSVSPTKLSWLHRYTPSPIEFLPDELFDSSQPVTFIALGYISSLDLFEEYGVPHFQSASLKFSQRTILTLALQSTGSEPDTFRRVGFASWSNCSWFGYFCLSETYERESWRRLMHLRETLGWRALFREVPGILFVLVWSGLLGQCAVMFHQTGAVWFRRLVRGNGRHEHDGDVRSKDTYCKGSGVEEKTVRII